MRFTTPDLNDELQGMLAPVIPFVIDDHFSRAGVNVVQKDQIVIFAFPQFTVAVRNDGVGRDLFPRVIEIGIFQQGLFFPAHIFGRDGIDLFQFAFVVPPEQNGGRGGTDVNAPLIRHVIIHTGT